jgi:hypothetical protein
MMIVNGVLFTSFTGWLEIIIYPITFIPSEITEWYHNKNLAIVEQDNLTIISKEKTESKMYFFNKLFFSISIARIMFCILDKALL